MKAPTIYTIAALLMLALQVTLKAQPGTPANPATDTIQWEYDGIQNLTNAEELTLGGQFTSYGGHGLSWVQNGESNDYSITVNSVQGDWQDIDASGELTYTVTCQDLAGTIKVYREGTALKIRIDFGEPGSLSPHIILHVNAYAKL